jgi:competence protein ComEC
MIGVFILAPIYFQWRIPQPQKNDISYELTKLDKSELVIIKGKVLDEPRLTQNNQIRLWLKVEQLEVLNEQNTTREINEVSGKLYVTLPLLEAKNIYSKQVLSVKGFIYEPETTKNPGQFNFKRYLKEQGCFAAFKAINIIQDKTSSKASWGWWKARRRIIRAQVKGLGSPIGQLVSSMVLGRRSVDLPYNIRDLFISTGLAHILAASGFHVSLLLGIVLKLTSYLQSKLRLGIGLSCLLTYSCLTGFSPSIVRAVLMGCGVLIALSIKGKIKPLGSLLLSLVIILLFNPLWIWNLGLQLSFLATLGLVVSVPILETKLNWLPPLLATVISIPIAASIWTLPLIIYTFNTISTYSVIINVISMPLVTLISLGGMISSLISLIIPQLGSFCASVLYYPSLLLIEITQFFSFLPGSVLAVGKIPLIVVIIVYILICLVWLNEWWQKRWWLSLFFCIAMIIFSTGYINRDLFKITILAANRNPVVIIQDKEEVILVNGKEDINTVRYTILPFLISQGINKIDYVITLEKDFEVNRSWSYLKKNILVENFIAKNDEKVDLENQIIKTNSATINFFNHDFSFLYILTDKYNWLIANSLNQNNLSNFKEYLEQKQFRTVPLVLTWSGNELNSQWLNLLTPEVAIASYLTQHNKLQVMQLNSSPKIEPDQVVSISSNTVLTYVVEEDGAITWTPKMGFQKSFFAKDLNS